jgi:hypothetical protein
MWNTDTFGWQESTDPIYKSIPYHRLSRRPRTRRSLRQYLAHLLRLRSRGPESILVWSAGRACRLLPDVRTRS